MNAQQELAESGIPKATRREWIGLGVLALPCLLYSMDLTVLSLAVPHLAQDLKPSASQLLWIVDIYGFLLAGALITMGTLGDRIGRRRLLMIGATVFGAVLSVIYGIKRMSEMLVFSAEHAMFIALGIVLAVLFVRRQQRLADSLIDLAMFRIRALRAALSINIVGLFAAFGFFMLVAQYFQLALGMGPLEAGLWSAPSGPAFIIGSLVTPALAHRIRPATLLAGAFIIGASGLILIAYAATHPSMALFTTGFVAFCFGIAPMGTLTTDIVMNTVPPARAGAASGISETSFELGGALGIALLGSFVTALYRSATAGIAPIAGIDIGPARETLAGAVAVARNLPREIGGPVLELARNAFVDAFTQAALVAAALCVVVAIISLAYLRRTSVAR